MLHEPLLLHTRLIPPRLSRRVLARPVLDARLREALEYRVTVIEAGTGYGKTTALATLDPGGAPCFWYSADAADADPQQFLAYLIAAFRRVHR
jgi:LuxR family transcriptional regulator, maltose regulon positive regulatory protein